MPEAVKSARQLPVQPRPSSTPRFSGVSILKNGNCSLLDESDLQLESWRGSTGTSGPATANFPREGHEVVGAATAAVGAVNRIALPRLRMIDLQVEILHVLDQRRVLVAGVFKRQQGIDRRVVEESLDVPGRFQSGLGVQPTPILASRHSPWRRTSLRWNCQASQCR